MSFVQRLWWKLTLSPPDYQVRRNDQLVVKDLNRLCQFFGLSLKYTTVWRYYDVPYHPTRAYDSIDYLLEEALKADLVWRRRMFLYEAMQLTKDIVAQHIRHLSEKPEWEEFQTWLKDV